MSVSPTESCTSSQRHRTVYDDLDLAQRPEDFRNGIVSAVRVASARRYLGATIASRAALKAAQYGVEWEPVTLAPSTLSDMTQTFVACQKSGRPFPVDTSWSSQDLFLTAAQQYAWRFLRAVGQIEEGGGDSFPDQLELGLWCLAQLDVTKTPPGSVVWRLLHAETVGRLYVRAISGRTVTDSVTFALASLTLGVDEAIADAVEAFAYDDSAEESPSDSGSPVSDRPPSIAERMKEIGWAVFGAGLGVYLAVQLLQSVWVWLMVFGLVVLLVGTLLWWRRRF